MVFGAQAGGGGDPLVAGNGGRQEEVVEVVACQVAEIRGNPWQDQKLPPPEPGPLYAVQRELVSRGFGLRVLV